MFESILCVLLLAVNPQDSFKKEMGPLQEAIDGLVQSTGARIMTSSRAAYLEGYGIAVALEVALEQPPNIFSKMKTGAELRASVAQRRKDIKDKLSEWLKQRIVKTESVGATESISIVVHLMNTTPNDVPDLPAQFVISVKKDAPGQVTVREY